MSRAVERQTHHMIEGVPMQRSIRPKSAGASRAGAFASIAKRLLVAAGLALVRSPQRRKPYLAADLDHRALRRRRQA